MPDLYSLLVASLTARLERARAATPGPWNEGGIGDYGWSVHFDGGDPVNLRGVETEDDEQGKADAAFIAANDPATEIRRVEAALRVVARHVPTSVHYEPGCCAWCCDHDGQGLMPYPCDDIRDLAAGEGIEVGDG